MAKQKGIIKVKGSLGGITFYSRAGEDLIRETSGVEKNRILNDPSFVRTRENNQEFGAAASIGKALRMGLLSVYGTMSDTNTTANIVKLVRTVIANGEGPRGQRAFSPVDNGSVLVNFAFSSTTAFDSIFIAPYTAQVNADRTGVTFTIPDFNTSNAVYPPFGATHFRLVAVVSVLSEYIYNSKIKRYEPTDPITNTLNGFKATDYIPVSGMVGADTTLTAEITPPPTLDPNSALMAYLGIEFYQNIGTTQYLLSSNNALKIQGVY